MILAVDCQLTVRLQECQVHNARASCRHSTDIPEGNWVKNNKKWECVNHVGSEWRNNTCDACKKDVIISQNLFLILLMFYVDDRAKCILYLCHAVFYCIIFMDE